MSSNSFLHNLSLWLVLASFFFTGCRKNDVPKEPEPESVQVPTKQLTEEQKKVKAISDSENLLQSLSSEMKALARSFTSPSEDVSEFVHPNIEYAGLDDLDRDELLATARSQSDDPVATTFYWPVVDLVVSVPLPEVWKPLMMGSSFEDAQIGVLKGSFPTSPDQFEMKTKFEGRIRQPDGELLGVKGYQTLGWTQHESGWKLASWKQEELKVIAAKKSLFVDVTQTAIPDEATRQRLVRSSHQEMILKFSGELSFEKGFKDARASYRGLSDWYSAFQYPSVSVVDVDQDGQDDLFVTDRWEAAQLLRNNGDGTFVDITESSGLVVEELANCAYFADFDNDGDSDVFVGISMGPSKFFTNENGKFVPDEATNKLLDESRFVLAAAVVDINRDGLLDLYLSTYAFGIGSSDEWFEQTTRPKDRLKTRMKIQRQHTYVDRGGPPNIVLMNRGGKFDWVTIDDTLKQFRDTYQTTWTDIDQDGDQDVYICNDFAPDVFLRNDTPQGSFKLKFTDVTTDVIGSAAMNFAMGASWGDYDTDGDLDLYVSNMYSKAGLRIVSQLDNVDERIRVSAQGNFLYENENGLLKQVAGHGDDQQHVDSVGWSYGGQFADFDNDGELDLYVPSGFYSPPPEIHTDKDL